MTTTKAPSVIRMGRDELANLMTTVNETLATDASYFENSAKQQTFGTLQLWNIRRQARYNGIVVR